MIRAKSVQSVILPIFCNQHTSSSAKKKPSKPIGASAGKVDGGYTMPSPPMRPESHVYTLPTNVENSRDVNNIQQRPLPSAPSVRRDDVYQYIDDASLSRTSASTSAVDNPGYDLQIPLRTHDASNASATSAYSIPYNNNTTSAMQHQPPPHQNTAPSSASVPMHDVNSDAGIEPPYLVVHDEEPGPDYLVPLQSS